MTPKVKIVTDSSSYLESEVVKKYDIRVVPIKVAFGTEAYAEGVDITNKEFYQRLIGTGAFPTTSQPSVGDFVKIYSELAQQGHPILSIHISSTMSGTVRSALSAKDALPQAQIEIIDSKTLAMGMLVIPAAEAAQRGQALHQIKASIEKLNASIVSIGMFDTLKYAWKGGRIGAAKALVGTLLKIKPVITFEDGVVRVLSKPRTTSGAIEYMVNFVAKRTSKNVPLHGWLAHARASEIAITLEKALRVHFNWTELRLFEVGPVYGTHMGPGFIGLGFYSDGDWQPE